MEEIRGPRGLVRFDESVGGYVMPNSQRGSGSQFDWGTAFARGESDRSVVSVEFKNGRRLYYLNGDLLSLRSGDVVCVGAVSGYDVGVVSLSGWLAHRSYNRWRGDKDYTLYRVLRRATRSDVDRWLEHAAREYDTMLLARRMALSLDVQMKVVDVEFQGDGTRAAFYYSAEQRVDFRELVRQLAGELHVRVEMRQIAPRQAAGLIGGLGTCGQTLCCKRWLRSYQPVTTNTVKTQGMTPNPQKQAGQCGKLKCCLNFEVDYYEEAKRLFPRIKGALQLEGMQLYHVKNDVFRHEVWFSTEPRGAGQHVMLGLEQVKEILSLNAEGKLGAALEKLSVSPAQESKPHGYENVIEEDSITRFDQEKRSKSRRDSKRGKQQGGGGKKATHEQREDRSDAASSSKSDSKSGSSQRSSSSGSGQGKRGGAASPALPAHRGEGQSKRGSGESPGAGSGAQGGSSGESPRPARPQARRERGQDGKRSGARGGAPSSGSSSAPPQLARPSQGGVHVPRRTQKPSQHRPKSSKSSGAHHSDNTTKE